MPMRLHIFLSLRAAAGPLLAAAACTATAQARPADSPFGAFAPALAPAPSRLAQHSPVPPRGRAVADSSQGRSSVENRSFEELMRAAQARGRGEYLGVEPDISRNVYRFKFMRPGGNVVWVDVDGRTARVLSERD